MDDERDGRDAVEMTEVERQRRVRGGNHGMRNDTVKEEVGSRDMVKHIENSDK